MHRTEEEVGASCTESRYRSRGCDERAAFMPWPVRLACAWGWLRRCVLCLAEQILRLRIEHHGRGSGSGVRWSDLGGCADKLI